MENVTKQVSAINKYTYEMRGTIKKIKYIKVFFKHYLNKSKGNGIYISDI